MGEIYHSWDGTVLTITSDSGTSSADLKGDMGVRGPQGVAGNSSENVEELRAKVNEIEESLNGYVSYEIFNEELGNALECYPTNDELWNNYYTKEELDAKNALIVSVDGSTPSATNAEIYEATQNGREIYLFLWSSTYMKATYISPTYAWFEGTYLSTETVNGKSYSVVKYRLFTIENDGFKQNMQNLVKLEHLTDLEARVAALEAQLNA